jgi:hypothetical protein
LELQFVIIWELEPEKVMELVKMVRSNLISIPEGYKQLSDFATPDGTLWIETVEVDSYAKISRVVAQLYPLIRKVSVHPIIPGSEFFSTLADLTPK